MLLKNIVLLFVDESKVLPKKYVPKGVPQLLLIKE